MNISKFLPWKKFKQHDEFALLITDEFVKLFPVSMPASTQASKIEKKRSKAINQIYAMANEYSRGVKLGIYSKARIGNKFMWALKEKGYDGELVDDIVKGLVLALGKGD